MSFCVQRLHFIDKDEAMSLYHTVFVLILLLTFIICFECLQNPPFIQGQIIDQCTAPVGFQWIVIVLDF